MPARLAVIPNAPEAVGRFQNAYSAVSRVAILHALLTHGPLQRVDLAGRLGITAASVRKSLHELLAVGYVTYRMPSRSTTYAQEQPHGTVYTAQRERIMSDLAATMAWLSEDKLANP